MYCTLWYNKRWFIHIPLLPEHSTSFSCWESTKTKTKTSTKLSDSSAGAQPLAWNCGLWLSEPYISTSRLQLRYVKSTIRITNRAVRHRGASIAVHEKKMRKTIRSLLLSSRFSSFSRSLCFFFFLLFFRILSPSKFSSFFYLICLKKRRKEGFFLQK